VPKSSENKFDPTTVLTVDAWNYIDFVCKNYTLNVLDNILYYLYSSIKSIKALWEALDKKSTKLKMSVWRISLLVNL
jgi:hypothetical protein